MAPKLSTREPRVSPSEPCEGILSSDEEGSGSDSSFVKTDIEQLGRQRPHLFSSTLKEVGFVTSIIFAMMMSEYFISGFIVVLPAIEKSLDMTEETRTWPSGAPNLSTAALLLPFARLGEMYGSRLLFLGGIGWLMIWSVVCGFSTDSDILIMCRTMQGVGNGAFLPACISLLGSVYRPGPRKNLVFSLYGAFCVVGLNFGMLVGGISDHFLNWRWYFWIGGIIAGIILVSGLLVIPKRLNDSNRDIRMDWWGIVTIVPGMVLVVYALTDAGYAPQGWETPYIYITFVAGVLFLGAAVYVQGWVSANPLLPPALFKAKNTKRLVAAMFCFFGAFTLFLFYGTYFIQTVRGVDALLTAAYFTPLGVTGLVLCICGGFVLHTIPGRFLMMIASLGALVSCLLLALAPEVMSSTTYFWGFFFPACCCASMGIDISFNVSNVFMTSSVSKHHQSAVGALMNVLMYLGVAFWLGVSELAIAMTLRDGGGNEDLPPADQYRIALWLGVGLAGVAILLCTTLRLKQASADLTADEKAKLERDTSSDESS